MIHPARFSDARRVALLTALALAPAAFAQEPDPKPEASANAPAGTLTEADLYGYWILDAEYIKVMTEEIKKSAPANDKSMEQAFGQAFLQMVMQRASRLVVSFSPGKTEAFDGENLHSQTLKIKKIEGNTFELESEGRTRVVLIENGRLFQKLEYDNRAKRPPMGMRRLSDAEVTAFKAKAEAAKRSPDADAPAEARLKFLVNKATPEQVDELLRTQKDLVTLKTPKGDTALSLMLGSSKPTKLAIAEKLLAAGADASTTSSFANKPLLNALFIFSPDREKDFIKLLVKHGAKLDAPDEQGATPLLEYCRRGKDAEFLKWMLDSGADLNGKTKWNQSPLGYAIEAGWAEGATLLIDRGAEVKNLYAPLSSAVRMCNIGFIRKLAEKGLILDESSKATALIATLEEINRQSDILRSSVSASFKTKAEKKKDELLAFLPEVIEHDKARLDTKDRMGKTALIHAQDITVAKALIAAGANIKANTKTTLLHTAAQSSPELIRFYIEKGLDVNSTGPGYTPLQSAVAYEHNMDCIKALLDAGADIKLVAGGNTVLTSVLQNWNHNKESAAYFDYLISKGADPKICGTANILATRNPDVLRRLVKLGVSVQPAPDGYAAGSPLVLALASNNAARVKLLIELGADPAWKGKGNESAIDWAKKYCPDKKELLDLLTAGK